MKLRVRTLANEEVEVETDASQTILEVKKKIFEKLPNMLVERQRVVFAGKILKDELKVSDYPTLKENDRLVVMVSKQSTASTPAISQPVASTQQNSTALGGAGEQATQSAGEGEQGGAQTSTGGEQTGGAAVTTTTAPTTTTITAPAQTSTVGGNTGIDSASVLVTGDELNSALASLEAMGFPREEARRALRAAYNNPDRAVEYLMNGIPQDISSSMETEDTNAQPNAADNLTGVNSVINDAVMNDSGNDDGSNPLEALRQHPTFNQLRQIVQANPDMLPHVLRMMGQSNPQLLELISQNQEAFLEMLQEPAEEMGNSPPSGVGVIQLNPNEMEALQRLEALGFSRTQAAEAYLACDRNEEMAANYLFENINDYDADDQGTSG